MAVADYTTAALLRSIKRRMLMPAAQATFDDEELLEMADEEIANYVVPFIRSLNEEHLIDSVTYSVSADANTFLIPSGATGESLREVAVLNGSGEWVPLPRVDPERPPQGMSAFYLLDESVVLTANPVNTSSVRLKFWRRPSKLIDTERARLITSAPTSTTINYDNTGDTPPWEVDDAVHVVQSDPGFRTFFETTVAAVDGITTQVPAMTTAQQALAPDQWLCLADESPVPQIPRETHALLAQAVATSVLFGRDAENYEKAREKLTEMEASARLMLAQRTQGAPLKFINRYGPGWGRRFRPVNR